MSSSITKRWIINIISVIAVIIVCIIIALSFLLDSYFYSNVNQQITLKCSELDNVFVIDEKKLDDFSTISKDYVENFDDKEHMEVMLINSSGTVTLTSTGFMPDKDEVMNDYDTAKGADNFTAISTGKTSSGESIMAGTKHIYATDGTYVGAIRFVVSMHNVNVRIFIYILLLCLLGILIMGTVCVSGLYFIRSIIGPIREMSENTRRMAHGDFDATFTKKYNDEIGDLGDSINYMASELKQSEQLKNDFISRVSHELRTPLTAIKGWAETMSTGAAVDRETFDKGMGIIITESTRLTGIVEELLDFSKIQSGRMQLQKRKMDIVAELDDAVYMLKEVAIRDKKHLVYDEPEIIIPPVMGDSNRLRQVFFNVIDNALKYSDENGLITIVISVLDGFAVVKVTDNGCGISAEDLPRVKNKFYKANQDVRGSGIGLAVADEIIEMHGGTLELESSLGIGTSVTIRIPLMSDTGETQVAEFIEPTKS